MTSRDQETIVAPSLDEAGALSRGTMLTDKWRALNADLFDMKFKVKINEANNFSNATVNRIGVMQHVNPSKTVRDSLESNEDIKLVKDSTKSNSKIAKKDGQIQANTHSGNRLKGTKASLTEGTDGSIQSGNRILADF